MTMQAQAETCIHQPWRLDRSSYAFIQAFWLRAAPFWLCHGSNPETVSGGRKRFSVCEGKLLSLVNREKCAPSLASYRVIYNSRVQGFEVRIAREAAKGVSMYGYSGHMVSCHGEGTVLDDELDAGPCRLAVTAAHAEREIFKAATTLSAAVRDVMKAAARSPTKPVRAAAA